MSQVGAVEQVERCAHGAPRTDASCDLQVTLYLAQCLVASGQWSGALDHYRFAGQAFVAKREPHNALAAYLLAAKLVPRCLHTQGVIAGLLHKLGRSQEALARLDGLAADLAARGEGAAALHLYRLALEIDPDAGDRRVWAAELIAAAGDSAGAAAQLELAAAVFAKEHRLGELLWVAYRVGGLGPTNVGVCRLVIATLLEVRDLRRAVEWLRHLMTASPGDVAGRELLAYCYALHGKVDVASYILRLLACETRKRGIGHCDEARRLLVEAVEWNPADADALGALRALDNEIAEIARLDFSEESPTACMIEELSSADLIEDPACEQERTNIVRFRLPGASSTSGDPRADSGEVIFAAFA